MLDNATHPCHSRITTDALASIRDSAPCGRYQAAWFVVRTAHNAERRAAIEIGQADFDVFSPQVLIQYQPPRRYTNGSVRPAIAQHIRPLFRRYVFVRFNPATDQWRAILRLPGVDTIISSAPENPTAVPQDAVDELFGRCDEAGVVKPLPVLEPEKRRGPVRLRSLAGLREWFERNIGVAA